MRRRAIAGWMAAAGLALAGAAAADWLVTRQGDRIETRGAWRRQGEVVVFTLPNGTLSSLRAAEIDFDASSRASAPAARPMAEEVKKKPVLVLRDKDVAHVGPEAEAAPGQPAGAEKGAAAAPTGVSVLNWHQEIGDRGLVVSGTVQNNDAKLTATDIVVEVRVFGADGKLLVSGPAGLSAAVLPPGKSAAFTVTFPVSEKPAALKFNVTSGTAPTPPAEP